MFSDKEYAEQVNGKRDSTGIEAECQTIFRKRSQQKNFSNRPIK